MSYSSALASREDGGLKGLIFTTINSQTIDSTVNVQWSADADFLAELHIGSDAYVTKDKVTALAKKPLGHLPVGRWTLDPIRWVIIAQT